MKRQQDYGSLLTRRSQSAFRLSAHAASDAYPRGHVLVLPLGHRAERGESFLWAKDLSAPDAIISWSANIPFISSTFGNHISLFCLLMTVVNIIYTRINMQSQASSGMPGMKWMMYLMPVMFLFIFNNYAAGLSYYYFLSLLITIVQTYIFRKVVSEDKMRAKMAEAAKEAQKKSGFMARLEEAQRKQQQMLREQQKRQGRR